MGQEVFEKMPPEYKWFAIDFSGSGWAYIDRPKIGSGCWRPESDDYSNKEVYYVDQYRMTGIDWKNTLIERQNPAQ